MAKSISVADVVRAELEACATATQFGKCHGAYERRSSVERAQFVGWFVDNIAVNLPRIVTKTAEGETVTGNVDRKSDITVRYREEYKVGRVSDLLAASGIERKVIREGDNAYRMMTAADDADDIRILHVTPSMALIPKADMKAAWRGDTKDAKSEASVMREIRESFLNPIDQSWKRLLDDADTAMSAGEGEESQGASAPRRDLTQFINDQIEAIHKRCATEAKKGGAYCTTDNIDAARALLLTFVSGK
jgi:hypothetical protein